MCDLLGKNLLLPSWFAEDFKEESSASLLGIFLFFFSFFCMGLIGEESSASSLGLFWGRIFCFLIRDCFNVLGSIKEESSASSMDMMLDMLEFLGKSLLLPLWG